MRKLIFSLFAFVASVSAMAQNVEFYVTPNNPEIVAGDTFTLSFCMKNDVEISGFQFFYMNVDGFTFGVDEDEDYLVELNPERVEKTHNISAEDAWNETAIMVIGEGTKVKAYKGTDGALCTFDVNTDKELTPGTYEIVFKEVGGTTLDSEWIENDDITVTVKVQEPSGIASLTGKSVAAKCNIQGQPVANGYRGVVIMNGKKSVQ